MSGRHLNFDKDDSPQNLHNLYKGQWNFQHIYSSINKQLHEIQMPGYMELMEVQETHPLHM